MQPGSYRTRTGWLQVPSLILSPHTERKGEGGVGAYLQTMKSRVCAYYTVKESCAQQPPSSPHPYDGGPRPESEPINLKTARLLSYPTWLILKRQCSFAQTTLL